MKSIAIFSLQPLAAAVAIGGQPIHLRKKHLTAWKQRSNNQDTRQIESVFNNMIFGEAKMPVSSKQLTGRIDANAIREEVLWGPFNLQAKNATRPWNPTKLDQASDSFNNAISGICSDCMVLAAQATFAHKNGTSVNIGSGVYTHHIIMLDVGKKPIPNPVEMKCGNFVFNGNFPSGSISVFLGKGDEDDGKIFAAKSDTVKTGFYIQKSDSIDLISDVVNYDNFDKDVYLRLEYEYVPGRPQGYLDIGMGGISVDMGCSLPRKQTALPVDRAVTLESGVWTVTQTGYLVNVTPHLHDGGINVKLYLNGKVVCTSPAIYGGVDGSMEVRGGHWETITSYESCMEPIAIKKGDKLMMTADYDYTKHKTRPHSNDAMLQVEIMAVASYFFAKSA